MTSPGLGMVTPFAVIRTRLQRRPESGSVIAAALVFVIFAVSANHFLTLDTWNSVLVLTAELGIAALGVTLLMIAGEYDLSVGSVLGVAASLVPTLTNAGIPAAVSILLALVATYFIGFLHGTLVTRLRVHSFIITLGGLMFWRAVVLAITGGFPVRLAAPSAVLQIFNTTWDGFYVSIVWFLVLVVLCTRVLQASRVGNWILATGGSPLVALQLGVPVRRLKVQLFALTSVFAGLAGIVQMARFSSVDALRGEGVELEAILAAVVGGALLSGGYGSILGTTMGALMISMIRQGLILAGVPGYWYRAGIALMLIIAATVNEYIRRRSLRTASESA